MRIQSVIARKGKIEILQLSGGEPTLHPEFFELVEIGYQIVALAPAFAASIAFTKRRRAGNPALISEYLLGTDERGNAED